MTDEAGDAEDQIVRLATLPQILVDPGLEPEALGIRDGARGGDNGADRREFVEGLGVAVLGAGHLGPLPESRGHVIAHRVPQDVIEGILFGFEILYVFADDHTEFSLVVELFGNSVHSYVLERTG